MDSEKFPLFEKGMPYSCKDSKLQKNAMRVFIGEKYHKFLKSTPF